MFSPERSDIPVPPTGFEDNFVVDENALKTSISLGKGVFSRKDVSR
jgi:hypothetical protein